jgi:hypothetical protein
MEIDKKKIGTKIVVTERDGLSHLKVGEIGRISEMARWGDSEILRVTVNKNKEGWILPSHVKVYRKGSILKKLLDRICLSLLIK